MHVQAPFYLRHELARLPANHIEGMIRWGWINPEMTRNDATNASDPVGLD